MKRINKIKPYLINIIIVLGIFMIVLLLRHISPFGEISFKITDGVFQYRPMLYDFIKKIQEGNLLNYSFNNGLGSPTIFEYCYYLASPLNLIAILFKTPDSMFLSTIIIKLIVGTIIMTYYTQSKTDNKYIITIATISYMFSSFLITYFSFITWLDIIILFPLFQKGLEDLLDKKKPNTYIISLALLTICNFSLSFSIYIYTIIYFIIYELFYKKQSNKEKINSFNHIALYTIITFIMIFIWIYILFTIFIKTNIANTELTSSNYVLTFIDLLKSLLYGNTNNISTIEGNAFPNIACNHFILMNIIYYFINNKISKKDKKYTLIAIIIILMAFYLKPFDYVLNLFHSVRGYPFRYSYIICFLSIKLMINNFMTFTKEDAKKILLTIPVIALLILITFKGTESKIIITNIIFTLSLLVFFLLYDDNKYTKLLLCFIVIIESFTITYINITDNEKTVEIDYSLYEKENQKYRQNYAISENESITNNLYYNKKVTYQFSSLSYARSLSIGNKLGCNSYDSIMVCTDDNQITNLLFNIKNEYYLEKIFAVDKRITLADTGTDTSIKENTENIISSMTGITDIYNKEILEATEKDDKYYFKTDYDYYLIEIENEDGSSVTIPQVYHEFTQDKEYGKNTTTIYTINEDKLKEIYSYLSKNQIEYTYYNDNKIEGKIHVDNNQLIYTSIPYDISWEIKIDGKKIKQPLIILDSFIGIETTPGDHTITMEYKNKDYIGPTIVSISTIIIYVYLNIKKKKA